MNKMIEQVFFQLLKINNVSDFFNRSKHRSISYRLAQLFKSNLDSINNNYLSAEISHLADIISALVSVNNQEAIITQAFCHRNALNQGLVNNNYNIRISNASMRINLIIANAGKSLHRSSLSLCPVLRKALHILTLLHGSLC